MTHIIAIQDYQSFLYKAQIDKNLCSGLEAFHSNYHPWGSGWNVRRATEAAIANLKANNIRVAIFSDED